MINTLKFMITDNEYILVAPDQIGECCDEFSAQSKVYFINEDLNIKMLFGYTESTTFYGGFGFKNIELLLNNKLFFDNDKRKDPGFESCQFWEDIIKESNVIDKYYFVSNNTLGIIPRYNSWFYNDKDGNIIFEISPAYPWENKNDIQRMADPSFIPYAKWIKGYSVVVRKVISRKTLIQWNEQTKDYTHVFEKIDH